MDYRTLEITVASARDLKDVNLLTKMDVYASVSIKGDPVYSSQKQKTPVDKDSGPNPNWNSTHRFNLDEASLQQNRLTLKFELKSERSFGDKEIGEVHVPVKELFDQSGGDGKMNLKNDISYSVRTSSGKQKGTLNFSFKFGEKCARPAAEKAKSAGAGEPVVAYPAGYPVHAGSSSVPPPPQGGYPPYPPHAYPPQPYPYPQAGGYPPPQPAYAGYPPAPAPGYGYPPPQYVQQPPKRNNGAGKMALGLGAGLLGGLLVGDMISDVGEMAAYDAGFDDAGFGF